MKPALAAVGLAVVGLAGLALSPPGSSKGPSESERIRTLPEEDRRWLTEFVAPIILPEERKVFLELAQPYQREFFKADFWERRERDGLALPLGPGYRSRYAELRRLADEKYDGWRQDAGRMVLRWGEPVSILSPRCAEEDAFWDLEVWTYVGFGTATRTTERHILFRPAPRAPRKLWTVGDESGEGARVRAMEIRTFELPFKPNSCRSRLADLAEDCSSGSSRCAPCPDLCQVYRAYREIRARQGSRAGAAAEQAMLFELPKISIEGLDRQRNRWATTSDPNARPIRVKGSRAEPVTSSPSVTAAIPTPAPEPQRSLSDEEIRDRILRLEPKHRDWLDVAIPLLSREELSRFLQLSPAEKDPFIREFWKKRS